MANRSLMRNGPEDPQRAEARHNLRTTLEVATLGFATLSASPLVFVGCIPVLDYLGRWGIELDFLLPVLSLACFVLPFGAGFYYGLRRQRQLVFGYVLLGWLVGITGSSAVGTLLLPAPAHTPARAPMTASTCVLGWLLGFGLLFVLAALLTLLTMYGQKRRVRSS